MVNKGRKLLALLTMLALIFTYSFSASGLSVYAEEEQGDANAKSVATEDKTPAEPKEEKAKDPAPAPTPAPAPAEEVGESGGGEPAADNDKEVKEEEANVEGEELEAAPDEVKEEVKEEAAAKQVKDPIRRSLNTNDNYTCKSAFSPYPNSEHKWKLEGGDGFYDWNANSHRITNRNYTAEEKVVTITHTITHRDGSIDEESWIITLVRDTIVNINYYAGRGDIVHTQAATQHAQATIWGVPERDGFVFLGWAFREPAPGNTHVDLRPGTTVVPRNYRDYIEYGPGRVATWKLYAVWQQSNVNLKPVTGNSKTVPYTGEEQTLYGITKAPDQESGFVELTHVTSGPSNHQITTTYYIKAEDVYAKGKEPGEYQTAVEYARVYYHTTPNQGGSPSETNMYVKVKPGTLTIEDADEITAEAISGTWLYDETAHPGGPAKITLNGEDVTSTWEREGIEIDYQKKVAGGAWSSIERNEWPAAWSQTEVGVTEYKMIVRYPGIEPVVAYGTLEVLETFNGEVTGNSKTVEYNEREQFVYGITADPDVEEGYVVFKHTQYTLWAVKAEDIYAKGTDPGEYTTEVEYAEVFHKANMAGGSFSSLGKYVKVNPGTLTIGVVDEDLGEVTGNSKTVDYTGEEQFVYGITKAPDQESGFVSFKSITQSAGAHVTGTEYFVKAEDIYAHGTKVGEYTTEVEYAKVYEKGIPNSGGTPSYIGKYVKVNPGTLTIKALPMPKFKVTAYDEVYDGDYHSVTVDRGDLPEDAVITYSLTGSETSKWTKEAPEWKDVELEIVRPGGPISHPVFVKATCEGYEPVIIQSYVKISPLPVEIDVTVTFNGEQVVTKPYINDQYIIIFNKVALDTENEVLMGEWDPRWNGQRHDLWTQGTDVGEYYTKVGDTLDDYELGDNVNPKNYEFTFNVTQGTLEIEAAPMPKFKVTAYDEVYDGDYHSVTVDRGDLPEDAVITYSLTGSETSKWTKEAPEWKDVELANVRPGGPVSHKVYVKATCPNYEPLIIQSYVKISPLPVEIDVTVTFNGEQVVTKPYINDQYIIIFDKVALDTENEVLMGEWDPRWNGPRHDLWTQGTDVGEYYTKVGDTLDDYELGDNVNPKNYEFTFNVTQGTLEIEAAPMPKFKVKEYDEVFDNKAHTVTVDRGDLPDDAVITYSLTGSETSKWTKEAPEWTYVELANARPGGPVSHKVYVKATCPNYEPLIIQSYVKISPRPVTVNVDISDQGESTISETYNGIKQEAIFSTFSYSTSDDVLNSMREFDPSYRGARHDYWAQGTDAGSYDTKVSDAANEYYLMSDTELDVNFIPTYKVTQATLKINKAPLTVTTPSGTKVYDGTALKKTKGTISGLVNNETAKAIGTGSRTAVGSSKNGYEIEWQTAEEKNYEVTETHLGTLTVTAAPAPAGPAAPAAPAAPVVGPVAPDDAAAATAIDDNPAPTAINDDPAPKAAPASWALINLICMLLTALLSLIMLGRYFSRREGAIRLGSIIPAVGAIIAFIVTENMGGVMQMTDKWTVLMMVILAVQAAAGIVSLIRSGDVTEE